MLRHERIEESAIAICWPVKSTWTDWACSQRIRVNSDELTFATRYRLNQLERLETQNYKLLALLHGLPTTYYRLLRTHVRRQDLLAGGLLLFMGPGGLFTSAPSSAEGRFSRDPIVPKEK